MSKETIFTGVLIEEHTTYTVVEVCQKYNISKELLRELLEYGLFSTNTADINQMNFNALALKRMEAAFRLHRDLDINLPGAALVLELLDQIEQINNELIVLKKQL